jgi:lysophospholipase L1-like esterase
MAGLSTAGERERRSGASAATSSRRLLGRRLALAATAIVLALGLGDLAARIYAPRRAQTRLQEIVAVVEGRDQIDFERAFVGDPELFWRLAPSVVLPEGDAAFRGLISNEQGLREDHVIPRAKPSGELRLLFVGDSVTFGYGVDRDETFVERVERELAARFPGKKVECINAGVPGYTLFQGARWLELEGWSYEPDLVVLNFGWNDRAEWEGRSDRERLAAWKRAEPPRWLAWSALAALATDALVRDEPASGGEPRLAPPDFAALLDELGARARERGVELLVLVGPARFNLNPDVVDNLRNFHQIELYEFGKRTPFSADGGPGFVDGVAALRALAREHATDELLLDAVHPTAIGHAALAAALVERLEPWVRSRS